MTAGDSEYVRRLGDVLRQRNVSALRAFLLEQAGRYGDERQVEAIQQQSDADLEAILHRMIVARPDLGDLHAASERWLASHGAMSGRQAPAPRPSSSASRRRGPSSPRQARRRPGNNPRAE